MAQKGSSAIPQTETKSLIKTFNGDGKNIILAITGASGSIYALRILRALLMNEFNVDLIVNEYAEFNLQNECGVQLKSSNIQSLFPELVMLKSTVTFHNNLDLKSQIFLNSYVCSGMIIAPASMNVISSIAHGDYKNLIEKAADTILSHSKPLIIVPRETPINRTHLQNMMKVLDAGGKIIPAMPSFEYNPKDFNDLADFIAGKVIDGLCKNYDTLA